MTATDRAHLERQRAFAFRRTRLDRAFWRSSAGRGRSDDRQEMWRRAAARAVREELGWSGASEAHEAILARLQPVGGAVSQCVLCGGRQRAVRFWPGAGGVRGAWFQGSTASRSYAVRPVCVKRFRLSTSEAAPNSTSGWRTMVRQQGEFTVLVVLTDIGERSVTPLCSTYLHVIGDEVGWRMTSPSCSPAPGSSWKGAAFFPTRRAADGGPIDNPTARTRPRPAGSRRFAADRMDPQRRPLLRYAGSPDQIRDR